MRALIAVGHGGIYSGGSHQALNALRGLKQAGVEVMAVWGPDAEGDKGGFKRLEELGIPYRIIPIHQRSTWRTLKAFRQVVQEFDPDVVECVKSGAQYHALFGGLGLNKLALVFYRGVTQPMDWFQGFKYRMRRVDRVIANCEMLKRQMAATGHIPIDKIEVIYGEYDPACAEPNQVNINGLREELNIADNELIILQLGNWSPWRGQHITLQAASQLKARVFSFHLIFAGRETDKLADAVTEWGLRDRVTLLPYRRDPERLLKLADIVVNSSTGIESLSGAILNAQAMGVPVAASNVGGSAEIVIHNQTGLIVPPQDPKALAEALEKLLTMLPAELAAMGVKARKRARTIFSPEIRAQKRMECYRKAIKCRMKNEE
ncbi:MAG: glycosyltransferase family 4 protein [Calditrichota bacterium]